MKNNIKNSLCLFALLSLCACATTNKGKTSKTSKDEHSVQKGTPNREDFVPLATPVIIEGSPEVEKK